MHPYCSFSEMCFKITECVVTVVPYFSALFKSPFDVDFLCSTDNKDLQAKVLSLQLEACTKHQIF